MYGVHQKARIIVQPRHGDFPKPFAVIKQHQQGKRVSSLALIDIAINTFSPNVNLNFTHVRVTPMRNHMLSWKYLVEKI